MRYLSTGTRHCFFGIRRAGDETYESLPRVGCEGVVEVLLHSCEGLEVAKERFFKGVASVGLADGLSYGRESHREWMTEVTTG